MKFIVATLVTLFAGLLPVNATITFLMQADLLKDSNGVAMSQDGVFMLVASTADATFQPILAGTSTAVGSTFGLDDRILFVGDLGSFGVDGVLDATIAIDSTLFAGLTTNDPLALYWFPTLTTGDTSIGEGTTYGFYTNAVAVDGSSAWLTPADPTSNYSLGFFTKDGSELSPGIGASNLASAGNAANTVSAVPEPSVSVLAMAGAMFAVFGRRRRRNRHP
ncbi:PEP-CTERM sorting domain-containing protein [Verrucomicrobium spinosum]|uniref:PEP-CTERM sorting domain-containing protein n=1 Tax=Verrucomicrobium spinosum TaxID=2736 RepID=UPI0001744C8B|nr:PEP-CTERM sorting domain-containing protein [Verrucomicrobium spinosum]